MIKKTYSTENGFNVNDMYRIKVITIYNNTGVFKVTPIKSPGEVIDIAAICDDIENNKLVDIILATEYNLPIISKRVCTYINDVEKTSEIVLVVDPFGLTSEQLVSPICRPRKEYLTDSLEPYEIGPYKGSLIMKVAKMDLDDYKSNDDVIPQYISKNNLIWQNAYSAHVILTGNFTPGSGDNIYLVDVVMRRLEDIITHKYSNNFDLMQPIEFGRLMVVNVYPESVSISAIIYLKKISNTQIEYIGRDGKELIIEESEEISSIDTGGAVFKNIAIMLGEADSCPIIYMNQTVDFIDKIEMHGKFFLKLSSSYKKLIIRGNGYARIRQIDSTYPEKYTDYKIDPELTESMDIKELSLYTNMQFLIDNEGMRVSKAAKLQDNDIIIGALQLESDEKGHVDFDHLTSIINKIRDAFNPRWEMFFELLDRTKVYYFTLRKKI